MKDVVIAGAARTPMGGFQGMFDGVPAAQLGGTAIRAALDGAGAATVDEVLMGCVLPAGQGQAPARQAGFAEVITGHGGGSGLVPLLVADLHPHAGALLWPSATTISFDMAASLESFGFAVQRLPAQQTKALPPAAERRIILTRFGTLVSWQGMLRNSPARSTPPDCGTFSQSVPARLFVLHARPSPLPCLP